MSNKETFISIISYKAKTITGQCYVLFQAVSFWMDFENFPWGEVYPFLQQMIHSSHYFEVFNTTPGFVLTQFHSGVSSIPSRFSLYVTQMVNSGKIAKFPWDFNLLHRKSSINPLIIV